MAERVLPDPPSSVETEPFVEGARQGRFLLRRCAACGKPHWYPRPLCPFCFGDTSWEDASGQGTIYTYTVMRRADPPYAIGYVELAEGPRMLTNFVDCDFDALAIGRKVELVFKQSVGGMPVACFKPSG